MPNASHESDHDAARGHRGPLRDQQSEALSHVFVRLKALEGDVANERQTRGTLYADLEKALARITAALERHDEDIRAFRGSVVQIARIAQVLEGAFGAAGLVGDVRSIQASVTALNDRLGRVEVDVSSVRQRMDDDADMACPSRTAAPVAPPDDPAVRKMSKVTDMLLKIIVVLAGVIAVLGAGFKLGSAGSPPPSAPPASTPAAAAPPVKP